MSGKEFLPLKLLCRARTRAKVRFGMFFGLLQFPESHNAIAKLELLYDYSKTETKFDLETFLEVY